MSIFSRVKEQALAPAALGFAEMAELQADKIVHDFLHAAWKRAGGSEPPCLSPVERKVGLLYTLECEVMNGGIEQFFVNPGGDEWHETLEALRGVGALRIASLFEAALSVFPNSTPAKRQEERVDQLEAAGERAMQVLQELTDEYYMLYQDDPNEDFYRRLASYIITNQLRIEPACLTCTVVKLAESIYADRAFDRLPILADALEEAGCTDADILNHCRQPGEHVRGCWVVDLLLEKK